jgi:uncharacterized membrane protein (UPF0127 family)
MKSVFGILPLAAMVGWLAAGCYEKGAPGARSSEEPAASAAKSAEERPSTVYSPYPSHAQPTLQTLKLWLGTNEISAELALTPAQVQTGMMWRTNMAEMEGMLFVFGGPQEVAFWMKNTLLPLSCAYIDPEGTIQEIYPMEPQNTNAIPSKSNQIQYVLEMKQGWFDRHSVSTGTVVRTELGSFQDTFFRR